MRGGARQPLPLTENTYAPAGAEWTTMSQNPTTVSSVSPRTKCTDCDTHFLLANLVYGRCPECDLEITEATARWEARQAKEAAFDERHRRRMERPLAEGELYEPPEVE